MVLTAPCAPPADECRRTAAKAPFRSAAAPRAYRAARAAVRVQAAAATASVDELNAQFGEPCGTDATDADMQGHGSHICNLPARLYLDLKRIMPCCSLPNTVWERCF